MKRSTKSLPPRPSLLVKNIPIEIWQKNILIHLAFKEHKNKNLDCRHLLLIGCVCKFFQRVTNDAILSFHKNNVYLCQRNSVFVKFQLYNIEALSMREFEDGGNFVSDTSLKLFHSSLRQLALTKQAKNITDCTLQSLQNLTYLDILESVSITDQGLVRLVHLIDLRCNANVITNESVTMLMNTLQRLEIADPAGLVKNRNYVTLSKLTSLTTLVIGRSAKFEGLELLSLTNLTRLEIPDNKRVMSLHFRNLINLKRLNIDGEVWRVFDWHLVELTSLTWLSLRRNSEITDCGLKKLTNLRCLDLSYNQRITNEAVKSLSNLEELLLEGNENITADGITSLRKLNLCTL